VLNVFMNSKNFPVNAPHTLVFGAFVV